MLCPLYAKYVLALDYKKILQLSEPDIKTNSYENERVEIKVNPIKKISLPLGFHADEAPL